MNKTNISLLFAFILGIVITVLFNQQKDAEETNRELVLTFYNQFFNQHQIDDAAKMIAENYIQHNPSVPDGKEPFVSYFRDFFQQMPNSKARIVRSSVDGDLVWLHVHSIDKKGERGDSVVDIFRVANGKIVEHWDVIQNVPQETANSNTMF